MPFHKPSTGNENNETARAFLQARVALFWKVAFFITLFGSALGLIGAMVEPGVDLVITLAETVFSGFLWNLCRREKRSVHFSRMVDACGMVFHATSGAFVGRFLLVAFVKEHGITSAEGMVMADAFMSMIELSATAMVVAIRAALIPSLPRRTIAVTAVAGIAVLLVTFALAPSTTGGLVWRGFDVELLWLLETGAIMWCFAIITCGAISWVTYGLRAEVREARRFGQYVLERKLGEGGMGEVYLARHGMMRRPSAIKLLRLDRSGEMNLQRFEREVQLTARLTHPNTITLFDYGRTDDGVFYYAMELLNGATLQRVVEVSGAQPAGRVVRILSMVCGALTEAHTVGLVHRDVKPANIMLCTQGGERDVVKLLDFGLVKEFEVDREVNLTGASSVVGTPQYMAPESIRTPESVDARADIYALGAVAYFLLAGVEVFDGRSMVELCAQHLHHVPPLFSTRGVAVPAELEALVLNCLNKDPALRPQSAAELRSRLDACVVEPWDADQARAWWSEHNASLEGGGALSTGEARTVAVDGAYRS